MSATRRFFNSLTLAPVALTITAAFVLSACQQSGPFGKDEPALSCVAARGYTERGIASWYGREHHGKRTASGQTFDMNGLTAAHRKLPLGTKIKVTNLENGKTVMLTVNDRGPYVRGRFLDVSHRAAKDLNFAQAGTTEVRIDAVETC